MNVNVIFGPVTIIEVFHIYTHTIYVLSFPYRALGVWFSCPIYYPLPRLKGKTIHFSQNFYIKRTYPRRKDPKITRLTPLVGEIKRPGVH